MKIKPNTMMDYLKPLLLSWMFCMMGAPVVPVQAQRFDNFVNKARKMKDRASNAVLGPVTKVPITGRERRISVSDDELLSLSNQQYREFMKSAKRSTNAQNTQLVNRVGRKLSTVVERYLNSHGYAADVKNFHWEFNLVRSKDVNAFCMPGGKIVVYEGILPYTRDETCLAIVLGHEIAHAVAKHSAEQISKQQQQHVATSVLGTVINYTVGNGVGDLVSLAANTGFSLLNLKYSRADESEADYMGLVFAAMAGYNPDSAVGFWQRMSKASGGASHFEWLRDHPSDATRIANIKKWLPKVRKYYKAPSTARKK